MTAIEKIAQPFTVYGKQVTARHIANAIDSLAHAPAAFQSGWLTEALLPGATYHDKMEAANRLMQRWRKLDLVTFATGLWTLRRDAWDKMQSAASAARLGTPAHD